MFEFLNNYYVLAGLGVLAATSVPVWRLIREIRRNTRHNRDIDRHRTPFWGRGGKLPTPKKQKRFVWQPDQDYDVIHYNYSGHKSDHSTTMLVPRDKPQRQQNPKK